MAAIQPIILALLDFGLQDAVLGSEPNAMGSKIPNLPFLVMPKKSHGRKTPTNPKPHTAPVIKVTVHQYILSFLTRRIKHLKKNR